MTKKLAGKTSRKTSTYKGLPLVDATKDLEICITKSDVSLSKRSDPANCAAACAIKRITKAEAEVHISRTYVKLGDKWVRFLTPNSISREITSFDRSSIFEPGTYNLKAPSETERLGFYRSRGKHTDKPIKRNAPHHITANIRESAK